MILLHIEHVARDFDNWKASFDNFAELRQKSGVRRYQVSRRTDDPNVAMIDLEFENKGEAEALLAQVQQVWQRVNGVLVENPRWWFSDVVETKELQR